MNLINGNETARALRIHIAEEVKNITDSGMRPPHLAAILVGEDGASRTYVQSKENDCKQVGFGSTVLRLDASTTEEELLARVKAINEDPDIDGLIVQLPLPDHIDATRITEAIAPEKDVDGFHTISVGRLAKGEDTFVSATPLGIMMLLEAYGIETSGKHCVVIGRSNIVGRPMSILMSRNGQPGNATVTLCHSRTKDIASFTRQADILIVALGKPEFVTGDMIKEGAVVIDVGITRTDDPSHPKGFTLKGDVHFASASDHSSWITPVPGGVGPMTRIGLLQNTLKAFRNKFGA